MTHAATEKTSFSIAEIRSIIIGLMLIILLAALDQTIVSVSLPRMAQDLGGASLLAWVVSGYLVAATVSTPIYGKLGDLYGRRSLLIAAIAIFLAASVLCALATSMPLLIVARVLQGIGGGGLLATSQAIIGDVVPLRERGRYQGYISVVYAVASVGGPVLGGYLTHYLSWRWVFWINLPLGAVAYLASYKALRGLAVPGIRRRIDYAGALLLTAGLSALLIAVTRVGQGVALLAPQTIALLALAVLVLAAFVWHEARTEEPVMPLHLFRIPTVAIGCAILFICFFQVVSISVLLPFGMQTLEGIGADAAALRLIAYSLGMPFGAFIGGRIMMHSGRYRPIQIVGTGALTLGVFLLAWIGPHASLACTAAMIIAGVAAGSTMPTSLVAVQNAVPQANIGVATAIVALFRSMGGAVGVAVLSAILFALMQPAAGAPGLGIEGMTAGGAAPNPEAEHAFTVVFLVAGAVALMSHLLSWMLPESHLESRPAAAAPVDAEG
ncbi:drug resistance transporter, EmrB/QacA subfamily [Noviherbaspirillum humi]|uniref:Drug resistance transporter, EmrB/QacA subfamily n=1 Tax=Noviherbaspirillum humi TaxID=1688639 RepID=A0A239IZH8_9BURK|nr:MDR family MFS transporter [Noviherbaspirillum humi]SNS98925.1 drug resistance transporter, EmrB/QacA subfamily [Noviherbaspirillum humi]